MKYHTFDILITSTGKLHHYQLFAQSTSQGEAKAETTINVDSKPFVDLMKQFHDNTISSAELTSLGTMLTQCLFIDDVNVLFNRSLGEILTRNDFGLRLRLRIEPKELTILPWEMIYSPEQQLFTATSVATPLSRYLNLTLPVRKLACPDQIRILAIIPKQSNLNTEPEKEILKKVQEQLRPMIKVDFLPDLATFEAIREAVRQNDYHIIHYAGHGSFDGTQGFLYLDHEQQSTNRINADQFAYTFLDYSSIQLVILNACQGASRSVHQSLVGLAPQLVLRGVPAVIAMQSNILDQDAILFATEFYSELCHKSRGGQVEIAISQARKALLQSQPQSSAFALPVLYLRTPNGRLWDPKQPIRIFRQKEKPYKKPILERWKIWVGIIAGVMSILFAFIEISNYITRNSNNIDRQNSNNKLQQQTLSGQIFDENNVPLAGVLVFLPEYEKKDTTDIFGKFEFQVEADYQAQVILQARKPGYLDINKDPALNVGLLQYTMEQRK